MEGKWNSNTTVRKYEHTLRSIFAFSIRFPHKHKHVARGDNTNITIVVPIRFVFVLASKSIVSIERPLGRGGPGGTLSIFPRCLTMSFLNEWMSFCSSSLTFSVSCCCLRYCSFMRLVSSLTANVGAYADGANATTSGGWLPSFRIAFISAFDMSYFFVVFCWGIEPWRILSSMRFLLKLYLLAFCDFNPHMPYDTSDHWWSRKSVLWFIFQTAQHSPGYRILATSKLDQLTIALRIAS